jgi:SAM-dependent methyltransferase
MPTNEKLKQMVKKKYGEIAESNSSCCGPTNCCGPENKVVDYTIMQDDYTKVDGYVAEADLGLGCGLPTELAGIDEGNTVVDLGSGAGNDVFVSRALVGESGKVIGLDFTQEMIDKANNNNRKLGYENVEFKLGEIESMPIENDTADVVVSNCVLNLVPDKEKAFAEMYRIIKPGGHFCVSDIVLKGELPLALQKSTEMYAGCVSGAIQQDVYLRKINEAGFNNVEIKKSKTIELPDNVLGEILSDDEIKLYHDSNIGIYSITVVGYKN